MGIVLNTSITVKLYCTQEEMERESGERWMRGKRERRERERDRERGDSTSVLMYRKEVTITNYF